MNPESGALIAMSALLTTGMGAPLAYGLHRWHVARQRARADEAIRVRESQWTEAWDGLKVQNESLNTEVRKLNDRLEGSVTLDKKCYRVVVVGVSGTGKSELVYRWANPLYEPGEVVLGGTANFDVFSRTVSSKLTANPDGPAVLVQHVFEAWDYNGEQLEEAQVALVQRVMHGLLFVVDLTVRDGAAVDEARVRKQLDRFNEHVLKFYFCKDALKNLQTVMLFINKSDVIAGRPEEVEQIAKEHYAPLIAELKKHADQWKLHFDVKVGSAISGHGTHSLMPYFVKRILPKNAYDEQIVQKQGAP